MTFTRQDSKKAPMPRTLDDFLFIVQKLFLGLLKSGPKVALPSH